LHLKAIAAEQVIKTTFTFPPGYNTITSLDPDCNDTNSSVHPGAAEICDGLDNDCNGLIDIVDAGGIVCGMATSEGQSFTLTAPAGKVFTSVDFASYGTPSGTCGNFTLGSCNASTTMSVIEPLVGGQNSVTLTQDYQLFGDPCFGVSKRLYVQARYTDFVPVSQTYYADADGDGFGNPAVTVVNCDVTAPVGYVSNNNDCDDTNYSIHPGAAEIGQNGIDDNCNGQVDELPYCTPVIEYPCDMWISNTTIGSINNTTEQPTVCTAGGYTDFSGSISTIAAPASTVNYSLTALGNGYQYGDIYNDYNNDGNFDGADETVATFTVQFLCFTANFLFEAVMHIHNDNCSKKDYDIAIHAYGVCPVNGPDINIQGNAIDIARFDFSTSVEDSTEFGTAASNTTVSKTYTIQNPGSETLEIYGIQLFIYDGTLQFDITTQPASTVLPGSSTTFTVAFSPEGSGLRFAYVRVNSDDCDEPYYDFAIEGTAESGLFSTLNLSVFLEGLYLGNGQMLAAMDESGPHWGTGIADKITVELHDMSNYANIIWSESNVDLTTGGSASVMVPSNYNGSYYLTVKHRNSIETVSMNPVSFSTGPISYDFDLPAKAHGNNLLLMTDGRWVIYGGDVNQDGLFDAGDLIETDNDAANNVTGYVISDVNGDGIVNADDIAIIGINASDFVAKIAP